MISLSSAPSPCWLHVLSGLMRRYGARWPLLGRGRPVRPGRSGLRSAGLRGWFRVLMTLGLLAGGTTIAHALDANTATAAQLETLNGVGPRTAQLIVQERERAGPYESLEDLSDRVRGIGLKRLARLRDAGLTAGGGAVRVITPSSIASPHFAPALPPVTPVPAGVPLPSPLPPGR
jgi:competence protein ComEA